MGDGRWAMGDGRWAMGDGRWTTGDGRRAMGDGRWAGERRRAVRAGGCPEREPRQYCQAVSAVLPGRAE